MANYTFGLNTIVNLPPTGNDTITIGSGITTANPFSFNPFASVTSVVDGVGTGGIELDLVIINKSVTGQALAHGATLFTVTSGVTSSTVFSNLSQTVTVTGLSAADAHAWLNNVYVLDSSSTGKDSFSITLKAKDGNGTLGSNQAFTFRTVPCFARGTLISTPSGSVAVEMLSAGDLVLTVAGDAKPVKWIGHRAYEAGFGTAEPWVRPVLIRAGALGAGLPSRDLRVSPQHAMLIDDVLVPAAALVNGASIVRDTTETDVEYYHIEMGGHELVFAEGAPSETFVDLGTRAIFDNADEYALLFGAEQATAGAALPRVEEGYQLEAIRRRLARTAGIAQQTASGALVGNIESLDSGVLTGWVTDRASQAPVEVDVLVDGEVVARVLANRYRADLEKAGLAEGRCGFSVALPPAAESLGQITLRRCTDGSLIGAPVAQAARV